MNEPLVLLAIAGFGLLFVKVLSKIIDWSLKLVAGLLAGLGIGLNETTRVSVEGVAQEVRPFNAVTTPFTESGLPVPEPKLVIWPEAQTLSEVVQSSLTMEAFALHVAAAAVIMVFTYGLMEWWYPLGLVGGIASLAGVVWLDYWWLLEAAPVMTLGEFTVACFAAGIGAGVGWVASVWVVEPVYKEERQLQTRQDDPFERLNL